MPDDPINIKDPNKEDLDQSSWRVIPEDQESAPEVSEEAKADKSVSPEKAELDLSEPEMSTGKKAMLTGAIAALFVAAFTFAPWDNPVKDFMGSVTEEAATLEELFGLSEEAPAEEEDPFTTGEAEEAAPAEVDSLEALFGEEPTTEEGAVEDTEDLEALFGVAEEPTPELPTDQAELDALFGLTETEEEEIPAEVEIAPVEAPEPVDYEVDTVTISPELIVEEEEIEAVTPLPEATPIITTIGPSTPSVVTPTYPAAPAQPEVITPFEPAAPVETSFVTDTPFPINVHTVGALIPPSATPGIRDTAIGGPARTQADTLRPVAPEQPQRVSPRAQYRDVAETGPEEALVVFLILFSTLGGYFLTIRKKQRA